MFNPEQMLNAYCNDPLMRRAMAMCQNKDENQLKETVRNIAKSRGIPEEQLQQMAAQFGVRL